MIKVRMEKKRRKRENIIFSLSKMQVDKAIFEEHIIEMKIAYLCSRKYNRFMGIPSRQMLQVEMCSFVSIVSKS